MNDIRIIGLEIIFVFFIVGMLICKAFDLNYGWVLYPSGALIVFEILIFLFLWMEQ